MQARRLASVALLGAAIAAGATRAHAELQPLVPAPPDPLKISVLTFGPGDHPFFKFGHDALWIHDDVENTDRVYNFGTFSFDSPRLIFDFLHGRMTYWLSVSGLSSTLASYEHENRSIRAQELQLDAEVKRRLKERLDVNAQPQNRAYKYDYFLDNCATRVRDAIDWAAGGRLRELGRAPARLSLRDQALRMTVSYLPLYVAIDLVLGPAADRRIDRWGEMFIPEELADAVDEVRIPAGPAGAPAPLARPPQQLFAAARTPPPRTPPPLRGAFFGVGLLVGALFWLLGRSASADGLARGARLTARVAMGVSLSVWGLVVGFVGCFLVYVWGWTDHAVAHRNQNLLVCAPWALALLVLGIGVAAGWRGGTRAARALAAAALAATIAALLVKVGIVQHQDNGRWIAFFAPAWTGITAGLSRLVRS
ncbi:MAG TPA: DUF4105 domain-containing protein [Polyangia bacterium]|nr:DUF4105 domain-containing protein [Polyangia bacterium]